MTDKNQGGGGQGSAHYKGFRNRNAWHLGQWVLRSAMRDQRSLDSYVNSLHPIYMEQDLYCLATSMGNHYEVWPKRAQDPRLLKLRREDPHNIVNTIENNHSSGGGGGVGGGGGQEDDEISQGSMSSVRKGLEITLSDMENHDRGCLRRVVIRGLPYEHTVDRRCVWKFCIADSAGDLKLLSAKEQIAQKIMRKARAGLERSKRNRTGNTRVYAEQTGDGKPLVGGEMFPRLIRHMTSEFTLGREEQQLSAIRENEELAGEHFSQLFGEIDVYRKRSSRSAVVKKKPRSATSSTASLGSGSEPFHSTGYGMCGVGMCIQGYVICVKYIGTWAVTLGVGSPTPGPPSSPMGTCPCARTTRPGVQVGQARPMTTPLPRTRSSRTLPRPRSAPARCCT